MRSITKAWLNKDVAGVLPLTDEAIRLAKAFAFQQWQARAVERGSDMPDDLSFSCKFCSLFVKQVFGGRIAGNFDHQYNLINGKIIDLSHDSKDVHEGSYRHDSAFFGNRDHLASLNSCQTRVESWVIAFVAEQACQADDDRISLK